MGRMTIIILILSLSVVACSAVGNGMSAGPFYPYLGATNATAKELTLVVNSTIQTTIAPQSGVEIPVTELPAPPWSAVLLSPSGQQLLSLDVPAADVWRARPTGEGQEIRSDAAFIELSCGRLDLFYGPPAMGPAPTGPVGQPGDCD